LLAYFMDQTNLNIHAFNFILGGNFVDKCEHQLNIFGAVCKKWKSFFLTFKPEPCKCKVSHCLIKCGMLPRKKDWKKSTCKRVAGFGYLTRLKYLHENGCPWDASTCAYAAKNGHLDCLQYAHENGCRWGYSTCSSANKNGHLDCLQYAHENGCPQYPSEFNRISFPMRIPICKCTWYPQLPPFGMYVTSTTLQTCTGQMSR
jgi:hypothetical protein